MEPMGRVTVSEALQPRFKSVSGFDGWSKLRGLAAGPLELSKILGSGGSVGAKPSHPNPKH